MLIEMRVNTFITVSLLQIFLSSQAETKSVSQTLKLVIDSDGGADDAMAITMSLLFEKYFEGPQVVALTTTFGNVNESQAIINAARILDLCCRSDIPIYAGAQKALIKGIKSDYFFGYDGLGDNGYKSEEPVVVEKVHAAIALIELSKKYEGELVIMAIGPLTNIALAISLDPDFIGRLSQLYVGAGNIYSKTDKKAEFNAAQDPEAYQIVSENARQDKVTIIPFSQVFGSLNVTKSWRINVFGTINTYTIKTLNDFERVSLAAPGSYWTLLDAAVAAIVLDYNIVTEYRHTKTGILTCEDNRGITTNNLTSTEPNSRFLYKANVESYKKFLIDVFSAELNK